MKTMTKVSMFLAFTAAFSFCMPAFAAEAAVNWKAVCEIAGAVITLIAACL